MGHFHYLRRYRFRNCDSGWYRPISGAPMTSLDDVKGRLLTKLREATQGWRDEIANAETPEQAEAAFARMVKAIESDDT